jgi:LysR family transcriptional regulator, transcriptional activator of nhaA
MANLNYHHLRYFWAVARAGNLTRASAELHLTPQTVSTQIKDLESAIGEALFQRSGRLLVLTDIGQVVLRYADEIFALGHELVQTLRGSPTGRPLRLTVGIADVLPKLVAHRLIEPALGLEETVRVDCHEGRPEELLAELAIHKLDVVLSDAPIPSTVRVRAHSHLLGKCDVMFMANARLATKYRRGFPDSLDDAPVLLPAKGTALRLALEQWFDQRRIRPAIVGEFDDSALLKVFGQAGAGVFAVPTVVQAEVARQYHVKPVGPVEGVVERFHAISLERKIQHPAVAAICEAARTELFTQGA